MNKSKEDPTVVELSEEDYLVLAQDFCAHDFFSRPATKSNDGVWQQLYPHNFRECYL